MILADFVHVILTHMNGHVSLPSVLAKITNDHRHQKFREFRSTINGMLENVRYEQSILQTLSSCWQMQNIVKCGFYTAAMRNTLKTSVLNLIA